MEGAFKRQKNRSLQGAVIRSAIGGVSLGLLAAGITLLVVKLCAFELFFVYYLLIGFGAAGAGFCALFFALKENEKKLAKRLDGEYALGERVQTMLEYEKEEGEIIAAQRKDAEEKLASLPKRRPPVFRLLREGAAVVLALAVFVTAAVLPKKTVAEADESFENTNWQIAALEGLIENVRESELEENLKGGEIAALSSLKESVAVAETVPQMKAALVLCVNLINGLTHESCGYFGAVEALVSGSCGKVAHAVYAGAAFYRAERGLNEYETVKAVASGREAKISLALQNALKPVTEECVTESGVNAENAAALASGLTFAVQELGAHPYAAPLAGFASAANAAAAGDRAQIFAGASALEQALCDILKTESYNALMRDFISARLAEIFSVSPAELPTDIPVIPADSGGGEGGGSQQEGDDVHGGGLGTGDKEYGNDEIYDPGSGEYVKVSEVLNRYYAAMLERLGEGDLSEETKRQILTYFDALFGAGGNG